MAQRDLVAVLRRVGEKRAEPAEWAARIDGLARIDLTHADLADLELLEIRLARADLTGANLYNSNLAGADLTEAALTFADLRRANLVDATLAGANLSAANLQGANLLNANLRGARLENTKLTQAWLVGADLTEATLEQADLRAANAKFAVFTGARVAQVRADEIDLTHAVLGAEQRAGLLGPAAPNEAGGDGAWRVRRRPSVSERYDDLFAEDDALAILGLAPEATPEDVRRAYRQRVLEYHPDRVAHLGAKLQEVARREFDRIQHAYESVTRHLAKSFVDVGAGAGLPPDPELARPPEAISLREYQDLAQRYPGNDRIVYNLGVKYFQDGQTEEAVQAFEKAVALNEGNEYAQYNLSVTRLLQELET